MKKKIREIMSKSSKNRTLVLVPTEEGLISISHYKNVMIIQTKQKRLFQHNIEITLKEDVKVLLDDAIIKLKAGIKGHLKFGRVYFQTDEGYIGIGRDYLEGKTNYLIPNLC